MVEGYNNNSESKAKGKTRFGDCRKEYVNGDTLQDERDSKERWREYFLELLNVENEREELVDVEK